MGFAYSPGCQCCGPTSCNCLLSFADPCANFVDPGVGTVSQWGPLYRIKSVVDSNGKSLAITGTDMQGRGSGYVDFSTGVGPFTVTATGAISNIGYGPDATTTVTSPPCYPNVGNNPDPRAVVPINAPALLTFTGLFQFNIPSWQYYRQAVNDSTGGSFITRQATWSISLGSQSATITQPVASGQSSLTATANVGETTGTLSVTAPAMDVAYPRNPVTGAPAGTYHYLAVDVEFSFCFYFCRGSTQAGNKRLNDGTTRAGLGYNANTDPNTGASQNPGNYNCTAASGGPSGGQSPQPVMMAAARLAAAPATVAARLATCSGCEMHDAAADSCRECGCQLQDRRLMADGACPVGKW